MEEKVAALRKAVAAEDEPEMRTAFSLLEADSHQLAEQLYKAASQEADQSEVREPAGTGGRGGSADEDVIDAEFKEEK